MNTKKLFVYAFICLFIFSPFLNLNSWAAPRTNPIMQQAQPEWECNWACETHSDVTCCYQYCSEEKLTWYQTNKFCFAESTSNPFQK